MGECSYTHAAIPVLFVDFPCLRAVKALHGFRVWFNLMGPL